MRQLKDFEVIVEDEEQTVHINKKKKKYFIWKRTVL